MKKIVATMTFLVVSLGAFFLLYSPPSPPPQILSWRYVKVPFSLSGHYVESGRTLRNIESVFHCTGVFKGIRTAEGKGARFVFTLEELRWGIGKEDTLLFAFERQEGGELLYRTAGFLSEEERRQLLEALQVDLSITQARNDTSLLLDSATLTLDSTGKLNQLHLQRRTLRVLRDSLKNYEGGYLFPALLSHLHQWPKLLPEESGTWTGSRRWTIGEKELHCQWSTQTSGKGSLHLPLHASLLGVRDQLELHLDWNWVVNPDFPTLVGESIPTHLRPLPPE